MKQTSGTAREVTLRPARGRKISDTFHDPTREPDEEWMITYMDTVTLLVTLFVLLLSFATINEEKFNAVAQGLSLEKYGSGLMTGSFSFIDLPPVAEIVPDEKKEAPGPGDIAADLEDQLAAQGLADLVDVKVRENVIDFQLNENVLFISGQADLIKQGLFVVARLVPMLNKMGVILSVEGHTDNVPISTERFPSNWELSAARAASVARELIRNGIEANRIHIRGYAETRPVTDNQTLESRQLNRRVNLVLHFSEEKATR